MAYRTRIYYSEEQKNEMWDRWQRGENLHAIGKVFDRPHSSIAGIISKTGGFRPPIRKRSRLSLTLSEREEISRGIACQHSRRFIAKQLGRPASTISREINRNGGYNDYKANKADEAAWRRSLRPKKCKLACYPDLSDIIASKLRLSWSPEQISGWLQKEYAGDSCKQVSHETIYKSLFVQTRGVLKKELLKHLRTKRAMRRSIHATQKNGSHGDIKNPISIHDRPASVEDRAVPGHWEGDLIQGSKQSFIATLVERHSRYVMLVKVKDKKTENVVSALIKHSKKLPDELYRSLTWDRGTELSDHQRFTLKTNIQVYFCDPSSPWQRGSNENTNRLLRQYFPKGTDLSRYSQSELSAVARKLNERPRKTLEYETPAERFNQCVALTS